jgi:hypothetical protein
MGGGGKRPLTITRQPGNDFRTGRVLGLREMRAEISRRGNQKGKQMNYGVCWRYASDYPLW